MSVESNNSQNTEITNTYHKLHNRWTLWAHLPHDTSWDISSYKPIITIDSVESIISLYKVIPENMISNCMLFLMREGIIPIWEDEHNKHGGCFSYKINNKCVANLWKNISYHLVGEDLTTDKNLAPFINGITISPKINFCIIKIWIANCDYQSSTLIKEIEGISSQGCLFKKHIQS